MSDLLREATAFVALHRGEDVYEVDLIERLTEALAAVPPPPAPAPEPPAEHGNTFVDDPNRAWEPPAEHLADLLRRADQCASTFENSGTNLVLAKLIRDLAAAPAAHIGVDSLP